MIDLHLHSHYSPDAEDSPTAMVDAALQAGVRLLSITDHNGIDHIEPSISAAEGKAIRVLPGLELTCACPDFGLDEIHLLAHFRTAENRPWRQPALTALLEETASAQAQNLTLLLQGLEIPQENLEQARGSLIESGRLATATRPALHLFKRCAASLRPMPWPKMKVKRDRVMSDLQKGNLWRPFPTVDHVLQVLTEVGATATLAHPGRYNFSPTTASAVIDSLIAGGLQGLEAIYYPQYNSSRFFTLMAKTKNCFVTVGSDSHSTRIMLSPAYSRFIKSAAQLAEPFWVAH